MTERVPDHAERALALDPRRSFICEAPAGSGKTELLTQRFLKLLTLVDDPENILAITFTRKATGEMRERVVSALRLAETDEPAEAHRQITWRLGREVLERDRQRGWHLRRNPSRLRIQTFDSLCTSLTRQLPLESTLGSQPRIVEDARDLYRQAARNLLLTLEEDVPWADDLGLIIALLDNHFGRFESLMSDMLMRRQEWLPLLSGSSLGGSTDNAAAIRAILASNFGSVIGEEIETVRRKIPVHMQRELVEMLGFAAANLKRSDPHSVIVNGLDIDRHFDELPPGDPQYLPLWLGLVQLLLIQKGDWRGKLTKAEGFPVGENAEEKAAFKRKKARMLELIDALSTSAGLDAALDQLRGLPRPDIDDEQWRILGALFTVLPVLAAQLTLAFKESNSVDFPELSIAAKRALSSSEEPTQLLQKMDYLLHHILVDEFQDTSQGQVDLLNQLTAGWEPGDGRTVFCVGDAMQSIYGFRGANVGLFLHCRQHGLHTVPLEPLGLSSNFRSQAGLVAWSNAMFAQAFPDLDNVSSNAVSYSPSVAVLDELPGPAVQCRAYVDHPDNRREALDILELIRDTRNREPEATIAVLVRGRNHARHILPLLQEAGIRFRAVDLEPLHQHAVIQDLLALTRALLHLADRTAWLALLRAPWAGLRLADLETVALQAEPDARALPAVLQQAEMALAETGAASPPPVGGGQSDLFEPEADAGADPARRLSREGRQRLQRVVPVLRQSANERDRKSLRQWIEGTWIALGGPAVVEDQTALSNAEVYFELLEQWEFAAQLPGFQVLKTEVEKLYAQPDALADESLQVMSIHKSKGLEFDVVIVPALQRKPGSDSAAVLMWQQRLNFSGNSELLIAPLTRQRGADNKTVRHPSYQYLRREQRKKDILESCRLLYVACTRARKRLFLSAHIKLDSRDSSLYALPDPASLLRTVWAPLQSHMTRVDAAEPETASVAQAEPGPRALHRLRDHWNTPALPEGELLERFVPDYNFDNPSETTRESWTGVEARRVGTLVHRYLQQFAEDGLDRWSAGRIEQCGQRIALQLRALGVPQPQVADAAATVQSQLLSVLQDDSAQFIFATDHTFARNEYAVTLKTGAASGAGPGAMHLVMDRVFTDRTGTRWIIDYKTSDPAGKVSEDDFVAAEIQLYRDQLRLYQRALPGGDQAVKLALYFPAISRLEEVTPTPLV